MLAIFRLGGAEPAAAGGLPKADWSDGWAEEPPNIELPDDAESREVA